MEKPSLKHKAKMAWKFFSSDAENWLMVVTLDDELKTSYYSACWAIYVWFEFLI